MSKLSFVGAAMLALAPMACSTGCTGLQANLAGSTPAQVTTLTEAEQATKVAANVADTIVNTVNVSRADLLTAQALSTAVSAALAPLETAHTNGQSLDFAAFNAALSAFYAFESTRSAPAGASPTPAPVAPASK